jgi:glycosyl transferase family 25
MDAVVCLSLLDAPGRTAQAVAHFHQVGLCREVILFRTQRAQLDIQRSIWASHREIARYALDRGHRRVLILEDDATFHQSWPALRPRLERAMQNLPASWWGFYLGHFPVQGHFVRPNIMRVRSACTHAYVANLALLEWLVKTEPMDASGRILWSRTPTIDGAFANLREMHALFPMVATQRFMGERRLDAHPRLTQQGHARGLTDIYRYREFAIFHCMRAAETSVALLAPVHWVAMRAADALASKKLRRA